MHGCSIPSILPSQILRIAFESSTPTATVTIRNAGGVVHSNRFVFLAGPVSEFEIASNLVP
jgi:hypothetical protein